MGALFGGNAGRQWGYKIGDKIVPPSIDRIDGGGPGRSGPRFEGGGLLSDIGNALMRPYGYRDRQAAMQAMRPNMRPPGLLRTAPTPARATEVDYADRFAPTQVLATEPDYADRFGAYSPPDLRMSQAYFNRLLQTGIDPTGLTPVGQPMTMDERVLMPKYMSDVRSSADSAQSRMAAAKRARYARAGAPFVVPLDTAAPRDTRSQFLSYLEDQGVPTRNIQMVMDRPDTLQVLLSVFERDRMLPINILQGLR